MNTFISRIAPLSRMALAGAWITVAAAVASGCAGGDAEASGATVEGRKVRVTTTTNFITDTVEQVGGDRVEVTGLMGPGVDPHLYKASGRDVRSLREADIIFYGGLQLEGKMDDLLEQLGDRQTTVAVTRDIPRDELLEAPSDVAEEYDPHVWFDVANWKQATETIRDELKEKDPEHADEYDRNAKRYLEELDELDAEVREQISSIPERQRVLVTSHDAFRYFGRAYGMEVVAIQGISTVAEASTSDIDRVAELLVERGVKAVFVESSVPRQTIEAVLAAARDEGADVRIGGELYSDAAGDEGTEEGTYIGMVRANTQLLVEGLR